MKEFHFNPFATKSIIIKFDCDKCSGAVISEEIFIPAPNYSAEKTSDSQTENDGHASCSACKKEFYIKIFVTTVDGSGYIKELPNYCTIKIEETFDPLEELELFWEIQSTEQIKIFNSHLKSIQNLLTKEFDEQTQFSLLVMLYSHIVSSIELFLSSTFIHRVTNSEILTRKLIETDPEFGNRKFTFKEIYQEQEKIKFLIAGYLKSLIFHNLEKVKPMYRAVLNIDFGEIDWLFKAVIKRHDCVHRAGYNKEGEKISITVAEIAGLIDMCKNLAYDINHKILLMDQKK